MVGERGTPMRVSAQRRRAQRRIAERLAAIDFALPGSIEVRRTRCGKRNCSCHADPPQLHGPYIVWTRKVNAKTVTRVLTDEQLRDYQAWFDNARKLRALVAELHSLSLEIIGEDKQPAAQTRPKPT